MAGEDLLEVAGLTRSFDGLIAVDGVDLSVSEGDLLGIIGPNGSGKTTLFNLLTGYLRPAAGVIQWKGIDLTELSPEHIVRAGIARTFQTVRFHKQSTVRETVWSAQALHVGLFGLLAGPASRRQKELRAEVERILELTWLSPHSDQLARELPFGLVRQLEIARALATRPKLLLMDEPASGMNPAETQRLAQDIRRLRDSGVTIILIEHDIEMVMGLCDRVIVLNFGRKIAEGPPSTVKADPDVISAYLGSKYRAHA
jgi:ABC-type branched-subunit amino acid transport system ATPase component